VCVSLSSVCVCVSACVCVCVCVVRSKFTDHVCKHKLKYSADECMHVHKRAHTHTRMLTHTQIKLAHTYKHNCAESSRSASHIHTHAQTQTHIHAHTYTLVPVRNAAAQHPTPGSPPALETLLESRQQLKQPHPFAHAPACRS
jgi:L-lactate utilization protein LutB